jgi:hypothetical protein
MRSNDKVPYTAKKSGETQEDLREISARNFEEIQETSRKLVNYNKNNLLNPHVVDSQKEFAVSTKELPNKAIKKKGRGGSMKDIISKSTMVVPRISRKVD